jgi:AbiV family abortive infection protein
MKTMKNTHSRKFINLSASNSIGLDNTIYSNSRKLKRDAIIIAGHQSYSTATSLLILSSEEVIKASLVLLHSQGYKVYQLQDASRFFMDHQIRHSLQMLIETGMSLFEIIDKWKSKNEKIKTKWFDTLLNFLKNMSVTLETASQALNRIEDIGKFNSLKNNGFYIDYNDTIQVPELTVKKSDYISVLTATERILKFYKQLRILFHPSIKKHFTNKEIQELKSDLHIFINDALKDVSLKEIKIE